MVEIHFKITNWKKCPCIVRQYICIISWRGEKKSFIKLKDAKRERHFRHRNQEKKCTKTWNLLNSLGKKSHAVLHAKGFFSLLCIKEIYSNFKKLIDIFFRAKKDVETKLFYFILFYFFDAVQSK